MALFVWNVCGLKGGKTRREALTLMAKFHLEIVGFFKTLVRKKNFNKVIKGFEKNWNGVSNSSTWDEETRDSILVMWNLVI